MRQYTGAKLFALFLKEIEDEKRLSPVLHCSWDFVRATYFRLRRVLHRVPREPGAIVARLDLRRFAEANGLTASLGLADVPGAEPRTRMRWTAQQPEPMRIGQIADLSTAERQQETMAGLEGMTQSRSG